MSDRYLRIVLTVIAIELAWMGVKDVMPTSVEAQSAATRVVITGVDMPNRSQFLPVAVAGSVRGIITPPWATLDVLRTDLGTINARIVEPVRIDTTRPLDVKSVMATGAPRPGL
ncbi:MAG TPA: hypothetical protein VMZ90_01350 [Vicinamibacterales bacterium]|nr:hypothetical protein [Vicinamibacterales bacterium]